MKYCAFDHESKHYATKAELQELRTEIQKEGREVEKALRESEKRITSALTRILVAIVIAGIVFVFKDSLLNLFS
ncbi:MAG: hypothetical protein M2R45_04050 [Verrucomicrobia subdivision 3 bacterium]|nr:hypothetical protein [Limisphaerales bacterium]MCS1416966.1 hypothetical protein [Limisphaerales bacterium]